MLRHARCGRDSVIARSLFARSVVGRGHLTETYLASRGIRLDFMPATLRYLPANPPNHLWPAMVAAYGIPAEPEPGVLFIKPDDVVGVQLTYLRHDGRAKGPIEIQKRSIGRGRIAP